MQNRLIIYIEDFEAAEAACDIIRKHPVIAFDMEGSNLGKNGNVSLIQIAISTEIVYIFDVLILGIRIFEKNTLLPILTDPTILKLCYDCRSDCATLVHCFGVHPYGFFDLQVVYTYVFQHRSDPYLKGYHKAMQALGHNDIVLQNDLQSKKHFKAIWKTSSLSHAMLFHRPLPQMFVNYCAIDVVYLFKMYSSWHLSKRFVVRTTYQRFWKFISRKDKDFSSNNMARIDFGKYWDNKL